jgi:ATP-binding cassette subfamily B protein
LTRRENGPPRPGPVQLAARLVAARPRPWLLNLGATLFANACGLLPAFLSRAFFDLVSGNARAGLNLWSIVALTATLSLGNMLGVLGLSWSSVPFLARTTALLQGNLFRAVLKRPGAQALNGSPSEAVSRFQGDAFDIPEFALWLVGCIGSLAWSGVSLAIMLSINPLITVVSLSPLLAVGLTAGFASSRVETYRRAARGAAGLVAGFIGELFGAAQAVKAATAEQSVVRRFAALNDGRRKAALKDRIFGEILSSVYGNIVNVGTGIVLLLAAGSIRNGAFTIGDLALFVYLLEGVGWTSTYVGMMSARRRQAAVAMERASRLTDGGPGALVAAGPADRGDGDAIPVDNTPPPPDRTARGTGDRLRTLDVEHLSFTHPSSGRGVSDVSFSIRAGSLSVVVGRIGSGKTTLLQAVLGLLPPDGGIVRWNGHLVESPRAFFVPPHVSYTAQVPRLFSGSVRENILMGLQRSEREIANAVGAAVLAEDLARLAEGLDTPVGAKGILLSGGQRQRVAAARMLVRGADLLVMDDLSSSLDGDTERMLWDRLLERTGGTWLVVSHRLPLLQRADLIMILRDGRIDEAGNLDELMRRSVEMRSLLRAQG